MYVNWSSCFLHFICYLWDKDIKTLTVNFGLTVTAQISKSMHRFILVFSLLYFLVVCEKTSCLNNDVMIETVKRIFSGGLKSHIPEELRIVSKFYENPKPELFSNQEISLTCLGRQCNKWQVQLNQNNQKKDLTHVIYNKHREASSW